MRKVRDSLCSSGSRCETQEGNCGGSFGSRDEEVVELGPQRDTGWSVGGGGGVRSASQSSNREAGHDKQWLTAETGRGGVKPSPPAFTFFESPAPTAERKNGRVRSLARTGEWGHEQDCLCTRIVVGISANRWRAEAKSRSQPEKDGEGEGEPIACSDCGTEHPIAMSADECASCDGPDWSLPHF